MTTMKNTVSERDEIGLRQKMKGTKVKYIPYMKSEEKTMNE